MSYDSQTLDMYREIHSYTCYSREWADENKRILRKQNIAYGLLEQRCLEQNHSEHRHPPQFIKLFVTETKLY